MTDPRWLSNPAHHAYLADPFVFRHEETYYAIGTGEPDAGPGKKLLFPMLMSRDFIQWETAGAALEPPDASLGESFWAPEIAFREGIFYLYYSVGHEDRGHQLRVATARSPLGPFQDLGAPVLDPETCPFAIDAHPFQNSDGAWYLFYARDFLDGERPGTALVVAPLQDMIRIPSDFVVVARARHDWQRYQANRPMYGGVYDWHTLEGPCAVTHEGRYYCLYSGGNWQNESYGLDYVWADNVMGPYVDDNTSGEARVLKTVPNTVIGPGHNSVVVGPNGFTEYIAYHAWDRSRSARRMCFDVLDWTPQGPRCLGPTWEPRIADW